MTDPISIRDSDSSSSSDMVENDGNDAGLFGKKASHMDVALHENSGNHGNVDTEDSDTDDSHTAVRETHPKRQKTQEGASSPVVNLTVFTFGADGKESLQVTIPEVLDPRYGMYVWPCAPVLAQYVWYHRDTIKGKTILELGAGTGLPGIVAAKCGSTVTLSDSRAQLDCLHNCRRSCQLNQLSQQVEVVGVTWGSFSPELLSLTDRRPIDVVLASDCFYHQPDFEDIIATVYYVLEKNKPGAQFWTTYQLRCADWSLAHLLNKWGLECQHIPLESFQADSPALAGSRLPGSHTVQMLVISLSGN